MGIIRINYSGIDKEVAIIGGQYTFTLTWPFTLSHVLLCFNCSAFNGIS